MKLDWNDITIVPAVLSTIASRSEVNPLLENGKLPIFTAPMDMVIDKENVNKFYENGINICLPRNVKYEDLNDDRFFYSYGLDEIIDIFKKGEKLPKKVLIDVANGQMLNLYNVSKLIKGEYKDNIELMVGNIANPDTYRKYCEIGVDYIRVGIGGGCFTPNSLIMTENGYKMIKDINIGDEVITHKNRLRKVLQKHTFDKSEKLLRVNDIECTKNHEFYVILKSDKDYVDETNLDKYAFWIESSNLDKNLHLLIKF